MIVAALSRSIDCFDLATGAGTLIRRATDGEYYYRLLGWK
jgi:hypothetical protein